MLWQSLALKKRLHNFASIPQYPVIRPERDLSVWKDDELDQAFGVGHFSYGYFFHVGDIATNVPHENKRCFGFYRLDASQWLKKAKGKQPHT